MANDSSNNDPSEVFSDLLKLQGDTARQLFGQFLPATIDESAEDESVDEHESGLEQWNDAARQLQEMWLGFRQQQDLPGKIPPLMTDPAKWMEAVQDVFQQMPMANPKKHQQFWQQSANLWESVLGQYGIGPKANDSADGGPDLPLKDRRFADPLWSKQPVFALIHQTYLMLAEQVQAAVEDIEGLEEQEREQLRFASRSVIEAMSPAHFPMINPVVLERTMDQSGENLVKGMERLTADLKNGQLTHTNTDAFKLGENVAVTPGKVVHETDLYQLIQYSPTTEDVLEVPLVIFPPWINRYYILDLNPKKSFVRWTAEQGITTFIVSWKSADESMGEVVWDDYIRAQIDAIDHIRARLNVQSVHTIGYCVAGTTLAATLAILDRRGEADKVKSTTFFTAQVDFEKAGELKIFLDDAHLEMIKKASEKGYLDGRYLAATFNLLRGTDLIWNYVVNNYLLGEDYPAFDLLYWNGDVTNLPAKWHNSYLQDFYIDNRMVTPDALSADGTPIDITRIKTPAYIQAGREDHIAPPDSVFRMTEHLSGPIRFVLAGSGHIAGVVNPPAAGKYQYWTHEGSFPDLEAFKQGATETPGSWWPNWLDWLKTQDSKLVPAKGKRKPGSHGDKVIEDAPGRYVATR